MSWIILSVLICIIENYTNATTYGPSLISLTKYNKDVHGPTIFHPETGRVLNLNDYPNYSVVVPLSPDNPTATSNQVFISRRVSGPGEFLVEAPEGHGVMAVVQSMDFRTAPTGGCNDFIQFGEPEAGVESSGTCGKVSSTDGNVFPSELIGPRLFLSPSGKMRVLFYHGYIWGLVRDFNFDLLDPSRNPVLQVEIVFTAYKDCDPSASTPNEYRPCSNSRNSRTCISPNLFCDRIVNCAFEEGFGSDEYISNCYPELFDLLVPRASATSSPINVTSTTPKNIPTTLITTSTTPTITTTITTTNTPSTSISTTTKATTTTSTTERPTTTTTPKFLETSTVQISTEFPSNPTTVKTSTTTKAPVVLKYNSSRISIAGIRKNISLEKPIKNIMTFSGGNELSVNAVDGKLEILQDDFSVQDDLEEESSTGLIILIISLVAVLIAIFVGLRIYCCYNTVIWVPNPKSLRKKRKEAEESSTFDNPEIPEVHSHPKRKSSTKSQKETPPPYDILFPVPGENLEV